MNNSRSIGFFDSGLGGIHVLANVSAAIPNENYVYFGDSANAPYGTKSCDDVRKLTLNAVESLVINYDIKALVIACNTATGVALDLLQEKYDFPVLGLIPALQVAAQHQKDGIILVMATPLTLKMPRYLSLYQQYGKSAVSLPCPGLMEFVEREELESSALSAYLKELLAPFQQQTIDAVVLGCTHYPYLKKSISLHVSPSAKFYDGIPQLIDKLKDKLAKADLSNENNTKGSVFISSSGGQEKIAQMKRMYHIAYNEAKG